MENEKKFFRDAEFPEGYPAKYSAEYRHFDILIWQTPILSSAILAFTLSAFNDIGTKQPIVGVLLLLIVSFILCTIYYILSRWRLHQQYTKRSNAPGLLDRRKSEIPNSQGASDQEKSKSSGETKKWPGGQFYLQLSTGLLSAFATGLCVHTLFFTLLQKNTPATTPCSTSSQRIFSIILGVFLLIVLGIITWKLEKKVAQHQQRAKILKMRNAAVRMINGSIDACIKTDSAPVIGISEMGDSISKLPLKEKNELETYLHQKAENGEHVIDLEMVAEYFDRIGDQAQKIAEWVRQSKPLPETRGDGDLFIDRQYPPLS